MTKKVLASVISSLVAVAFLAACGGGVPVREQGVLPLLAGATGSAASVYPQARVDYRVSKPLPGLAADAPGYQLASSASTVRVARLASGLGLKAPVISDSFGWTVAGADLMLRVQRAGGMPWTLSSRSPAGAGITGCAVAAPGAISGGTSGSAGASVPSHRTLRRISTEPVPPIACPAPKTVPGLPSRPAALRLAQAALIRAGFDLQASTVEAWGGASQWDVVVVIAVGGVPVLGSPFSVSVGPRGRILAATGWVPAVASSSDYRLVGLAGGARRLQEGAPWILPGGPGPTPMIGVSAAGGRAVASGAIGSRANGPTGVACSPDGACVAPGSPPESSQSRVRTPGRTARQAPVTVVTVTGARLALGWAWPANDSTGRVWLLPVYVFMLSNGETLPVLAVADQRLTLAAPSSNSRVVRTLGLTPESSAS